MNIKIIPLHCPNCNAPLSIPDNLKTITCNACQSTLSLFQNESISALELISEGLGAVAENTNIVASELTLKRLKEDLSKLREKETPLLSMVQSASLYEFEYYYDSHVHKYMSESISLGITSRIRVIYQARTQEKLKFSYNLTKEDIDNVFVLDEDYKTLISKVRNFKEILKSRVFSSKKQLGYIDIYISRIEELIQVKNDIRSKQEKTELVKKNLIS